MPCRADRSHGSLVQAWMVHLKEPEARKSTKPGFRRWRMWWMKTFSPSFPLFFEYQELFGGSTFFSESTTSEIWNPRKNCGEFDGIYGRCYVSLTVYVFLLTCTCDVSMYVDYISLFSQVQHLLLHSLFLFSLVVFLALPTRCAASIYHPTGEKHR